MKIIEQSHEVIREPDYLKLIELAGRTCYKSEDKITNDSAKRFVQILVKSDHLSVLEHAHICFEVESWVLDHIGRLTFDNYLKRSNIGHPLISGNFRAWMDFFYNYYNYYEKKVINPVKALNEYLTTVFPDIFIRLWFGDTKEHIRYIPEDQMVSEEKLIHATRTVRFITDRGVTHELVRHRPWAYSHESTRYVKYDGEMEFIRPVWSSEKLLGLWDFDNPESKTNAPAFHELLSPEWAFFENCYNTEKDYKYLIDKGWRPEQARSVLSNSLKTEIICTATLKEWKHMLTQRTSKAAHPQIRELMKPVLEDFQKEFPEIFGE